MKEFVFVFLGSGIGGILRYLIASVLERLEFQLPIHTLAANGIACIIIGYILAHTDSNPQNSFLKFAIAIGFCGGLSTYSAFSFELVHQISHGEWLTAFIYTILTFTICLGLTYLGIHLGN